MASHTDTSDGALQSPQFSDEYRRLTTQHRDFESRLSELQRRPFLSTQEQIERTNLKKYKLRIKDKMEQLARQNHDSE